MISDDVLFSASGNDPDHGNDVALNQMKKLFDQLPEKQGKALWLLFGLGMTHEQAAREMKIPVDMVAIFEELGFRSLRAIVKPAAEKPIEEAADEYAALDGMKEMFRSLPEQQGKALWLLYGIGMSREKAAREMGVAPEILDAFRELGIKTLAAQNRKTGN